MRKSKLEAETEIPRMKGRAPDLVEGIGTPVSFTCPECSGPIREIKDSTIVRFRCQVGHAYSAQAMFAGRLESLEAEMWHLVSSSEESRRLALMLARQARKERLFEVAKDFERTAKGCQAQSEALQHLIQRLPSARYDDRRSGLRALRVGSKAEVKARVPGRERNA
jgi:two-component system chemotaxis response regulator CheB